MGLSALYYQFMRLRHYILALIVAGLLIGNIYVYVKNLPYVKAAVRRYPNVR